MSPATFGPPEHLTPQDLVALLKVTRPGSGGGRAGSNSPGALSSDHSATRVSGDPSSDPKSPTAVQGGVSTPTNNACPQAAPAGGSPNTWFQIAANSIPAYVEVLAGTIVTTLPFGATVSNPDYSP